MKRVNYLWLFVLAMLGMAVTSVVAQVTNVVPTIPAPLPQTKVDFWDLAIGAVSPIVIWGLAKVMPKIPKPLLPTLTPLIGIGLGFLVNWLAGQNLSWFEAAKAGALAVFFRETVNQWVTKRMVEPDPAPKPPTPPTG